MFLKSSIKNQQTKNSSLCLCVSVVTGFAARCRAAYHFAAMSASTALKAAARAAHYLQLAISKTREGIAAGQTPFGAVIVFEQQVVAASHNLVWATCDPTAHAEIIAIREAARILRRIDLSGCTIYTTTEPCPMCLSAIHWAKLDSVVYGATIADAASAGFCELKVSARDLVKLGGSKLRVKVGPLRTQCRALFDEWKKAGKSRAY
jgi:tRNA(Arg) A34 adenosine deaminase TadA